MPLLLALLLIPLLVIVLIPVSLVVRIRRGTMRRQARRWVVTANTIAVTLSTAMFLIGALITSRWVPEVLRVIARRPRPRRRARAHRIRAHPLGIQPRRGALHAESLARTDRDALRRRAHHLWCLAHVGRVAGWCRADRRRGCLWDRDVDRGWRGRARLLLDLLDRRPSSSSLFARTLTDASADRLYVPFSLFSLSLSPTCRSTRDT